MAGRPIEKRIRRRGVVEFDDPDTGRHVVIMEGMTVESGGAEPDAVAVVSVATVVSCGSCLRRWLIPIGDYRQGWSSCRHCGIQLYLPAVFAEGDGSGGGRTLLTLCAHEFEEPAPRSGPNGNGGG